MTKANDVISSNVSDDELVRAHLKKHGATQVKAGVHHDVSDRKWEGIVKAGVKVPLKTAGGLTRDPETPSRGNPAKFGAPLKYSVTDKKEQNQYKHDQKKYDTPVRYQRTGPKKGGVVKVIRGHKTFSTAALSDGDTPKKGFPQEQHPNQNTHPRFPTGATRDEKMATYDRRVSHDRVNDINKFKGRKIKEETVIDIMEKYVGFTKLKGKLSHGGVRDPGALAASIGRKKYGAKKFNGAAHEGKKMHEELSKDELERLAEISDSYDASIEEAKRGRKVPTAQTIVSSPLKGQNQDQSGVNTKNDNADYTISDEHVPDGQLCEIITAVHPVHAIGHIPGKLPAVSATDAKKGAGTMKAPAKKEVLQQEALDVGALVDRIKALPSQPPVSHSTERDELVRHWQQRRRTDD